jgi:hypothetical protein
MVSFRRWSEGDSDIEKRLQAARVAPRQEFVNQVFELLGTGRRHSAARAWSRLAFAGAFTTLILGAFASFGGLGYAAAGVDHTYQTVSKLVVKHHLTVHQSAAADQYPKNPTPPGHATASKHAHHPIHGRLAAQRAFVATAKTGTLPFTGFSLVATVLVSLALIAAGILLRRRGRTNS